MHSADNICVIIPCYNNAGTLRAVVESALQYISNIIVVCDGCTDGSEDTIDGLPECVERIIYTPNRGKSHALEVGFNHARQRGYEYAITMDADGQHYASDLPAFFEATQRHHGAMIVGCRTMEQENKPAGNTFANKFSNFWFMVQTWKKLPDTQSGFRAYPIYDMNRMKLISGRYEGELEYMVRMAWRGIDFVSIPIKVYYAPEGQRVTHFRKGRDFMRISILNTMLCIIAICYGYPSMLIRKIIKALRK